METSSPDCKQTKTHKSPSFKSEHTARRKNSVSKFFPARLGDVSREKDMLSDSRPSGDSAARPFSSDDRHAMGPHGDGRPPPPPPPPTVAEEPAVNGGFQQAVLSDLRRFSAESEQELRQDARVKPEPAGTPPPPPAAGESECHVKTAHPLKPPTSHRRDSTSESAAPPAAAPIPTVTPDRPAAAAPDGSAVSYQPKQEMKPVDLFGVCDAPKPGHKPSVHVNGTSSSSDRHRDSQRRKEHRRDRDRDRDKGCRRCHDRSRLKRYSIGVQCRRDKDRLSGGVPRPLPSNFTTHGLEKYKYGRYMHVEVDPNGGATVVHMYQDQIASLDKEQMQQLVNEYFQVSILLCYSG